MKKNLSLATAVKWRYFAALKQNPRLCSADWVVVGDKALNRV